jgi:hypothetical protein
VPGAFFRMGLQKKRMAGSGRDYYRMEQGEVEARFNRVSPVQSAGERRAIVE